MLSLIGTLSTALALANTAPFLLVSGKTALPAANGADMSTLEASLSSELESCNWDAYVFAHLEGITEREINANTMPHLQSLIDKSAAHRSIPAVQNFEDYAAQAEDTVRRVCTAEDVQVGEDGSFELYQDSKPRVMELNLGNDPAVADETLSHVIGHLVSGNFLLVLRSSPPSTEEAANISASGESKENSSSNLFTDYVFFSPGIFMGTMVSISVASVLFISLGWLNSLLVSYKAFEKQEKSNWHI